MEPKNRNEMDPRYTWDLSVIFANDDAWAEALNAAEVDLNKLEALPGTVGTSADSLRYALDIILETQKAAEKVCGYAFLRVSEDNGDPMRQEMQMKAQNYMVKMYTLLSFLEPEILAIPEETMQSYLADPRFADEKHMLENIRRMGPHTLDAEKERMLAALADTADTPSNVFTMFESTDMTFESVKDDDGNELSISHGSMALYRENPNRRIRKDAFTNYHNAFRKYINTITAAYAGAVKMDDYFASMRGYASACEASLYPNNIPVAVYDSLLEAVHNRFPVMGRYLALRKKVMKLDELHHYDLYVPMVENADAKMTFEKAKELVKEALKPLGEEYGKLLDRAFAERWIDVYENKGKTTGAYSMGVYGSHPFVLLNFAGTLDDAFTLAHELGHSMHSYHSDATQAFVNHDYALFVAEVASTVNEVLLTRYLLKTCSDPKQRAYILNHFLEGFRTTVFRQTEFAEFERKAHDMYHSGEPLTAQNLNKLYSDLNAMYYPGLERDEYLDVEWARIPHFYRAFYVYQYATGFSSAVVIADRILNHNGKEDYLKFLSAGSSVFPIDALKYTGVDLNKPETVEAALSVFEETLAEMEKLVTE